MLQIEHLTTLTALDLSYNQLASLPLGRTFFPAKLQRLDLSHNRLRHLSKIIVSCAQLRHLSLAYNNDLEVLHTLCLPY